MTYTDPERVSFEEPTSARAKGRSPIRRRDGTEARKELVEQLARVGLAFDRHGRVVVCKQEDQEVLIDSRSG